MENHLHRNEDNVHLLVHHLLTTRPVKIWWCLQAFECKSLARFVSSMSDKRTINWCQADSFEDSSQQSSDWCLWRWHVQLLVELLIWHTFMSTWVWIHQKIWSSQRSFCPTPTGDQTQRNSGRVVRARTGRLVLGQPSDPGRAVKRKVWSSGSDSRNSDS